MSCSKNLEKPIKFELDEVLSWGTQIGKFGGYSTPIVLSEEDASRITTMAEENGAKSQLYGSTMYLKPKALSDKQKKELLNKGRINILVHFTVTGVYTNKDGVTTLSTKVHKLRKLEGPTSPQEEAPED